MTKVLKKYFSVKKSWLQLRKVDKLTFRNQNRKKLRKTKCVNCSWILKILGGPQVRSNLQKSKRFQKKLTPIHELTYPFEKPYAKNLDF